MSNYRGREQGDTIVEVLIAIAVVSLVLAGAYVSTNRSLQATRAAQERVNALKLAESQMEQIKSLASISPEILYSSVTDSSFCIAKATGQPVRNEHPTHDDEPACAVGVSGDPTADQPIFEISITRDGDTFTLTETWTDVSGRVDDSLQLRYRVYE